MSTSNPTATATATGTVTATANEPVVTEPVAASAAPAPAPAAATRKVAAKRARPVAPAVAPSEPAAPAKAFPTAPGATKSKSAGKSAAKSKRAAPVEPQAPEAKREKLVRDSFTMPKADHAALAELKQRALRLAHPVKKSELVRAGLLLLRGLDDGALLACLNQVPAIKTGRPAHGEGKGAARKDKPGTR